MILLFKIWVILSCGALNAWGGYSWHNARRFLMPALIAVSVSYLTHIWWLGLCCLPAMGTLCLGYSKGGNSGRGLWLFIQAVTLWLGITLLHHLSWFVFIPYCILAGVLGGIYRNWYQPVGDFITGIYLCAILLLIR